MSQPTIAIVGASADRSKYGNKAVRAYAKQGYRVFPINPREGEVEGLTAYPSISDLPVERLERVSLYVPPSIGLGLLPHIAAKGCDELWLNPGSESAEVVNKALELGLNPIIACSIIDVGEHPDRLD